MFKVSCCNCGDDFDLDTKGGTCSDCGGFTCSTECLGDHECDPEGDME